MIYFDNAATTPLSAIARSAALEALTHTPGNPASPHALGIEADRAVRHAANTLAHIIGCLPEEIIFTSGGTESNNLALLGAAARFKKRGGHILSTSLEHPAVLQPLKQLSNDNIAVTFAPVANRVGLERAGKGDAVDETKALRGLTGLIKPDTFMVSCCQVCNETGDINDIARIAAQIKQINPDTLVHVDGAQGFCKEIVSLAQVDLYSFSAHKIHGFKGVGGLMVRRGTQITPLLFGGGQQGGLRPGTENVPGIVSLAAAASHAWENRGANHDKVTAIRSVLASLTEALPDVYINRVKLNQVQLNQVQLNQVNLKQVQLNQVQLNQVNLNQVKHAGHINDITQTHQAFFDGQVSPYILNMSFIGVKGETLVNQLSSQGIYIATGAACRSRKSERSPLYALGYDDERVSSAVRFSFSPMNTVAEAETVKQAVVKAVCDLRRLTRR